ncbi:hypothetical protein DOY81_010064 [Sarcophaga bullata]|nr:hypothetical protein DOY81_010064 [Sarcophaga bullata]
MSICSWKPCMGSEIWTMLRDRGSFDDNTAQFIIDCSVLQQTTNHIPLAHDELLQPPSPTVSTANNRFLMPLQCTDITSSQEKLCEKCKKLLEHRISPIPEQRSSSESRVTPDSNGSSIDSTISEQYQSCNSRSASTGNTSETWAPGEKDGDNKETGKADTTTDTNGAARPKAINPNHPVLKKQGVSGESCEISMQQSINIPIPKYEKDYSSKQLIKEAIMDNDFLKNIGWPHRLRNWWHLCIR